MQYDYKRDYVIIRSGDKMEIMKFVLGDHYRSNCYIIHENNKAFIIDPGCESFEVIDYIKDTNLMLEGIYLTHGHPDHVGGVKQLKDMFDVLVYAPIKDKIWFGLTPYNQIGYEIPVDVWVKDLDVLHFLNLDFTVYETPGHSKGGTVLYSNEILFSGDTLFFQSIGRTDFPLSNPISIQHSLRRIFELFNDDTLVYPGHGKSTTIGHEKKYNPFIKK